MWIHEIWLVDRRTIMCINGGITGTTASKNLITSLLIVMWWIVIYWMVRCLVCASNCSNADAMSERILWTGPCFPWYFTLFIVEHVLHTGNGIWRHFSRRFLLYKFPFHKFYIPRTTRTRIIIFIRATFNVWWLLIDHFQFILSCIFR